MTDDLTRRAVLRRGAAATGTVAAGVAGLSGTAVASVDCPRSVEDWTDHYYGFHRTREQFRLDRTGDGYDADVAWDLLHEPHYADKTVLMAKQVVATQANVAAIRSSDGEACSDAVDAIRPVMESAITWLDCTGGSCGDGWAYLAAPEEYTYTYSWTDSRGVDGESIWEELKAFNEGRHCDGCGSGDGPESESGGDEPADDGNESTAGGSDASDGQTRPGGHRPRPEPLE